MELLLYRDYRDASCTLGTITNGVKKLQTMERPWVPSDKSVAGRKGVSCVAPGRYRLERHNSDAHPNVWALVNPQLDVYHWESEVPTERRGIARTVVLIHAANYAEELRGCIAPGTTRGKDGARKAVWNSRDALNQFRTWIGGSLDTWLTISEEKLA
jgi:hypothetical protein